MGGKLNISLPSWASPGSNQLLLVFLMVIKIDGVDINKGFLHIALRLNGEVRIVDFVNSVEGVREAVDFLVGLNVNHVVMDSQFLFFWDSVS